MRVDVYNTIKNIGEEDRKLLNKSELARRLGCDRRTIDKYMKVGVKKERKQRTVKTKIDDFKEIIIDKVDRFGIKSKSAYTFIKKKGYNGSYSTVNNFINKHKSNEIKRAYIRFETSPGLQAQVDWKEEFSLVNKYGELFTINIFLIVMGYSRYKYIKLTDNRKQRTLFECLHDSFLYFKGVPKEIIFDNMSTVMDRNASTLKNLTMNKTFNKFAIDAGFDPKVCMPYRPQTKGKVETVAKIVGRLEAYNEEFETFEDLDKIVKELNEEINSEISQSVNEAPSSRFEKEKEYLNPFINLENLVSYFHHEKEYKVSRESMINYKGKKYSVPTKYIGKSLNILEKDSNIQIYYNKDLIVCHKISKYFLNYKVDHAKEILKSDAFRFHSDDEISKYIENNLKHMDLFLGE